MQGPSEHDQDAEVLARIKRLPPSVGVTLMTAGFVGAVLPGSVGAPLILAGGMVLAPKLFLRLDDVVRNKFPGARHHGLRAINRFLDDFERRYPPEKDPTTTSHDDDRRGPNP